MNDPTELALVGGSSLTVGGFLMGLLKWSSGRNIAQLDSTIKELSTNVKDLTKSVHEQREKDIGFQKDLVFMKTQLEEVSQRIESQEKFWRNQFEEQRRVNHQRLEKATMDLITAIDAISKVQIKGRR